MRHLRRKLTLRAHGEQVVFVKRKQERIEHVWMKAFLWALYLPEHPDLSVEVDVGDKYKPDVVAMDRRRGTARFWGEAGHVGADKIEYLVTHYPHTHFVMSKWATALDPFADLVREALGDTPRHAPFDLIRFPPDSGERFIDDRGRITLTLDDVRALDGVTWRRIAS
jgi:hypothetical protein